MMDDQQILDNAPPKQGKWPDCNQVDSDGKWSHRQSLIRSLADIKRIAELKREVVKANMKLIDCALDISELKEKLSHAETMGDREQSIRDLEQQAKGAIRLTNIAIKKLQHPTCSQLRLEYFKAGVRALAFAVGEEAKHSG